MSAVEQMRAALNATGLYRLTGDTPGDWELEACGAGFHMWETAFRELLGELFVTCAPRERLDAWEELYRPQPSCAGTEARRKILRELLAAHPDRPTAENLEDLLLGAGLLGAVREEEDGSVTVCLGRLLGLTQEAAELALDRLLPAHLPWKLEKSVTWASLDAHARTFEEWNAIYLPWEELDAWTYEDLEREV